MPRVIYALLDKKTNKIKYVGVTKRSISVRLKCHIQDAKSGVKNYRCNWIRNCNFQIEIKLVETVPQNKSWQEAEKKWIKYYRNKGIKLTNLTEGGEGSFGYSPSLKTRQKKSKANKKFWKNRIHHLLGKKLSLSTRRKMSKSKMGNLHCFEYKQTKAHIAKRLKTMKFNSRKRND